MWEWELKAWIGQADFSFRGVVGPVVCDVASECVGLSRRATPGAEREGRVLHAADSRADSAGGCADCIVSGFARGADPFGLHVSGAGGRGGQMGTSEPRFEGRRLGSGGGPTTLGPE